MLGFMILYTQITVTIWGLPRRGETLATGVTIKFLHFLVGDGPNNSLFKNAHMRGNRTKIGKSKTNSSSDTAMREPPSRTGFVPVHYGVLRHVVRVT